jgi:hypothetical protein
MSSSLVSLFSNLHQFLAYIAQVFLIFSIANIVLIPPGIVRQRHLEWSMLGWRRPPPGSDNRRYQQVKVLLEVLTFCTVRIKKMFEITPSCKIQKPILNVPFLPTTSDRKVDAYPY